MSYIDLLVGAVPLWAAASAAPSLARKPKSVMLEQREHPRRPLDQHPVEVVCSFGVLRAELVDLSLTGAKLRLFAGLGPNAGEEITIRFADGVERQGAVAWTDHMVFGVSLRRPLRSALD